MTSQTEACLQLPKINKSVRTNNLLSDTWLLQRDFTQADERPGLLGEQVSCGVLVRLDNGKA